MAKKVVNQIKLQIPAGKATPSPPVGPALGQAGVNIPAFCKEFNAATQHQAADAFTIPVIVTVYSDRSFTFLCKTPPVADLLKKAASVSKGSASPNKEKVGTVTHAQIQEIAKTKLPDLNTTKLEAAQKTVEGTARSMGININ